MRVERKLFLIAPSVVLVLVCAAMFYTATRLQLMVAGSDDLPKRAAFIASVERGERTITTEQAVQLVQFSLDAEVKRTAAIVAAHDLLSLLGWIGMLCCIVLLWTIRRVPRELPLQRRQSTA